MAIAARNPVVEEWANFLAPGRTAEEIANFEISDELDERLHDLLDKNSREGLSVAEREEMNQFIEMGNQIAIIKAKARRFLMEQGK